jgi:flagellar biosynthesis component FlhA
MINFIVITKGSVMTSEVAARFTLDAIPGKQMSIDADLNAGLINENQARKRRQMLEHEADFYGSMDGAIRFVRGDAIAGILITVVNILGGFTIGVFQQDMGVGEAAQVYTLLTIGDGLVSQLPALVVSTAAGLVVTRAVADKNLPEQLISQLLNQPYAFIIASLILFFFGIIPGLPHFPFFVMSILAGIIGCILPVIPGPPLSYVGIILLEFTSATPFSSWFMIFWFIVAAGVTVLDYIIPVWSTKKYGGSKYGTRGSMAGLIIGLFAGHWPILRTPGWG